MFNTYGDRAWNETFDEEFLEIVAPKTESANMDLGDRKLKNIGCMKKRGENEDLFEININKNCFGQKQQLENLNNDKKVIKSKGQFMVAENKDEHMFLQGTRCKNPEEFDTISPIFETKNDNGLSKLNLYNKKKLAFR